MCVRVRWYVRHQSFFFKRIVFFPLETWVHFNANCHRYDVCVECPCPLLHFISMLRFQLNHYICEYSTLIDIQYMCITADTANEEGKDEEDDENDASNHQLTIACHLRWCVHLCQILCSIAILGTRDFKRKHFKLPGSSSHLSVKRRPTITTTTTTTTINNMAVGRGRKNILSSNIAWQVR